MLIDTHVHSNVSFDAKNSRSEMALAAQLLGMDLICFTDHYDVINEKSELILHYDWSKARSQQKEALSLISVGCPTQLLYGLELGNAPANFTAAEKALKEPELDFVIGAIHNTSLKLHGLDYYDVDYRNNPELARNHLEDYFSSLSALIQWGKYDTLGHLPYPLHYMRDRDGLPLRLEDYRERYYSLLKQNAEKGCAIEINADRGHDNLNDYRILLADWKAVGGKYVTVGADAHKSRDIGKGIRDAYSLLQTYGFEYVTYYEKRTPICVRF